MGTTFLLGINHWARPIVTHATPNRHNAATDPPVLGLGECRESEVTIKPHSLLNRPGLLEHFIKARRLDAEIIGGNFLGQPVNRANKLSPLPELIRHPWLCRNQVPQRLYHSEVIGIRTGSNRRLVVGFWKVLRKADVFRVRRQIGQNRIGVAAPSVFSGTRDLFAKIADVRPGGIVRRLRRFTPRYRRYTRHRLIIRRNLDRAVHPARRIRIKRRLSTILALPLIRHRLIVQNRAGLFAGFDTLRAQRLIISAILRLDLARNGE